MEINPGKHTTEHYRTWRAESLGIALVLVGIVAAFLVHSWAGVAIIAIGALLVGWVATSYSHSRGSVKAAGARRPADQARSI